MYVAVKGGAKAIEAAHRLMAKRRRGNPELPGISLDQIREQLGLAVDRVMAEGSLYSPELAALAVKQARGDLVEAIFLLRAARATFPRFGYCLPVDTGTMRVERRISATWKDLPGGQLLGPTFDYTHRLLDYSLMEEKEPAGRDGPAEIKGPGMKSPEMKRPKALKALLGEGLMEAEEDDGREPGDITRQPVDFPVDRAGRLQNLARSDEGFTLALAYSTQRGFGSVHPFVAELRQGTLSVEFTPEELGFPVTLGEIDLTECETVNQFKGGGGQPPTFTRGYGLAFGHNERKALAMAIVDRALRAEELGEEIKGPAQNQEFVFSHSDNVEAAGFVSHIKLPHYVDFQAELSMLRQMRKAANDDQR
ncbi:MAG: carbon-phosphorus lyase complex subunit PhnI [Candidatus Adiutrix sp.]|jgi:alpha-D-ribose 1-methylphosphonate 5-triphosphate synthase subunit PhnI|nr:carbon-phosphorus lyase complex subunit PhnI [Candidatus Adiutrix sp.]